MRCWLIAGMVFFLAGCVGDERVPVDNADTDIMRQWFQENLDDPHWDEVSLVDWDGNDMTQPGSQPAEASGERYYEFKIRTMAAGEGKAIQTHQFWLKDGRVKEHSIGSIHERD